MLALIKLSTLKEQEGMIERLTEAYIKACHREREAFIAGYDAGHLDGGLIQKPDIEYAWQQHRCQDPTDWRTAE